MAMSDRIEAFILELLKEDNDWLEIGRNELASVFNCVPSQINYVISTRFSPDRGYVVESRRGGGGYLRIKRVRLTSESPLMDAILKIGSEIDQRYANSIVTYLWEVGEIDEKNKRLILSAIGDRSPINNLNKRDEVRAVMLKNMIASLM